MSSKTLPSWYQSEPWSKITKLTKLQRGYQPLTHRTKIAVNQWKNITNNPVMIGRFKKPEELTIIVCHNYKGKSLFEESLDFFGVKGCINIFYPIEGPFKPSTKIEQIRNYLNSRECTTEYVLYCDARDTILRDDPRILMDVLHSKHAELLFGSTMFKGGWQCMPEVFEWTKTVCKKKGRYLNSGVFIGRTSIARVVFEDAMQYVTKDSLTWEEYFATGRTGRRLCEKLPEFPKNGPDQDILRRIHPEYYPLMDVDYRNELVYRN